MIWTCIESDKCLVEWKTNTIGDGDGEGRGKMTKGCFVIVIWVVYSEGVSESDRQGECALSFIFFIRDGDEDDAVFHDGDSDGIIMVNSDSG